MPESEDKNTKLSLIEWIIRQDDPNAIKALADFVDGYQKKAIDNGQLVGFRLKGVRVLKHELVDSLIAAIKDCEQGNFTELERLEEESDSW